MRKKYILTVLFASVAFACASCGQIQTPPRDSVGPVAISDGTIVEFKRVEFEGFSLAVPKDFAIMNDEMLAVKYPNGNPPTQVYTNPRGTINVALVMNDTVIKDGQIAVYMDTMKATFETYAIDSITTELIPKNGHNVGEMCFLSTAIDTDIYNHLLIFSVDDKLRIINFNCTRELMDDWAGVSDVILDSLMFT